MHKPHALFMQLGRSGGGPRFLWELARAASGSEDLKTSLAFSSEVEIYDRLLGVGAENFVVRTPTKPSSAVLFLPRLLRDAFRFRRYVKQAGIEVVVICMEQIWQALFTGLLPRHVAVLHFVHDATMHPGDKSYFEAATRWLERRNADGCIVLSAFVESELRRTGSVRGKTIFRSVHAAFSDTRPEWIVSRPAPSPEAKIVLGFFGRFSAYKGLDVALDAAHQLRVRGYDVRLNAVGSGDLGLDPASYPCDSIENRWVPEDEIEDVLNGFDVLVLPYQEASQSGVLTFASSMGLPSVVTPIGGLTEQASHLQGSVVAKDRTSLSFADAIEKLVTDGALFEQLSLTTQSVARTELSWNRVVQDVFAAIDEVGRVGVARQGK